MTDRCHLDPACEHGPHEPDAHPCGQRPEPPGSPCRHCGDPVPLDGEPCPACWIPVTPENAQAVADELSFAVEIARLNREEGYPVVAPVPCPWWCPACAPRRIRRLLRRSHNDGGSDA